jgi:cell division protein FtsW
MTDVMGLRPPRRTALRLVKGPAPEAVSSPSRPVAKSVPAEVGRRDATRLSMLAASLTGFGLVIVLSASSVVSIAYYGTPWSLFERQVMWTALGVVAFAFASRSDLRRVRQLAVPLLVITLVLLVAVLAPGIGKTAGGSSRWVGAGPIRIQPSELAKLAFAIFAADLVARREHLADQIQHVVRPMVLVLGLAGILILKQPDMGTAIVLVCIATSVLYAGGVRSRILVTVMGGLLLAGSVLALSAPYRRARLLSFIDPFAHASTSGYQVVQSLEALGSGHLIGTGLGGSVAKWGFLPNAQTDFIFAVIGNELGLIGGLLVLLAFAGLGALGLRIAARSTDRFAALLATGLTCWIVCQAFINVGGVIGILPETGIPLPFLSFGGSSLVVALGAIGLLVNIARHPEGPARQAAPRRRLVGSGRGSPGRRAR